MPERLQDHPLDQPLHPDEVRAALWHAAGNIQGAARVMRCKPARIAALLRKDSFLANERALAAELQVDRAEHVILSALEADDTLRQDDAAKFILQNAGKIRGWSRDGGGVSLNFGAGGGGASVSGGSGAVSIRWETPLPALPEPKMIDITPKDT